MILSYLRTIVLYLVLILAVRVMGKRQIGEMEPAEFVVTMLVANLAAIPMQDGGIPLLTGLIPILTVLGVELVLSAGAVLSIRVRRILCGKPVILMENGNFLPENLKSTRITLDELTGLLRQKNILDPRTVQYAILETNGELSVFPFPANAPASAKDAGVQAKAQYLPVTITDFMATCLYTGIATDTGCFQYDNVSAETHRTVAALMDLCPDVRYSQINRRMFAVKSFGRLQLEQLLIDHMEQYLGGKCILICVTQEFLRKFQVDEAELEGIAGLPLQVEGAEVGITMKEKESGKFRVSMRSADRVNVSAICQTLGGGGHVKAAGCLVTGTAAEARQKLLKAVSEGLEQV